MLPKSRNLHYHKRIIFDINKNYGMVDVDNKMYMVMILKDIYLLVQLSDAIIGYMLNSIDGRTLN